METNPNGLGDYFSRPSNFEDIEIYDDVKEKFANHIYKLLLLNYNDKVNKDKKEAFLKSCRTAEKEVVDFEIGNIPVAINNNLQNILLKEMSSHRNESNYWIKFLFKFSLFSPLPVGRQQSKTLSTNMSYFARKCHDFIPNYKMGFETLKLKDFIEDQVINLSTNINDEEGQQKAVKRKCFRIGLFLLHSILSATVNVPEDEKKRKGTNQQMDWITMMNKILPSFGYKAQDLSTNSSDFYIFEITDEGKEPIILCEWKDVSCLPKNFEGDKDDDHQSSVHECRFGFAAAISKFQYKKIKLSNGAKGLYEFLFGKNVADKNKGEPKKACEVVSNLTESLLDFGAHCKQRVGNPSSVSSADKEGKKDATKNAKRKRKEEKAKTGDESKQKEKQHASDESTKEEEENAGDEITDLIDITQKFEWIRNYADERDEFQKDKILKLSESIEWVYFNFSKNLIGRFDHLSLFHATTQCAVALVRHKKKLGVVGSNRALWYLRLVVKNEEEDKIKGTDKEKIIKRSERCVIEISRPYPVGNKGYLETFLKFVNYANGTKSNALVDEESDDWLSALGREEQNDDSSAVSDHNGTNGSEDDASESGQGDESKSNHDNLPSDNDDSNTNGGGSPNADTSSHGHSRTDFDGVSKACFNEDFEAPPALIRLRSSSYSPTSKRENACQSSDTNTNKSSCQTTDDDMSKEIVIRNVDMSNDDQQAWQVAFLGADSFVENKKQVFLNEIQIMDGPILGKGRCGEVKKVKCKDHKNVAMKEFTNSPDQEAHETPLDVYNHELDIFYELKDCWGTHVPRLLYQNPWPTCPSIVMQKGDPMPDDFNEWKPNEIEKRDNTIKAIEEKGFTQTDMRGANFVRLDGGHIAMIDFEDVVRIKVS